MIIKIKLWIMVQNGLHTAVTECKYMLSIVLKYKFEVFVHMGLFFMLLSTSMNIVFYLVIISCSPAFTLIHE